MMKSVFQIVKVSLIIGITTHIFNTTLFLLYPKYLLKEKISITVLEKEFTDDLLNMKYILFYVLIWLAITSLYFFAAKFSVAKLYRKIIMIALFFMLISTMTSIGYSLHLLGYTLFVIFSLMTFLSFYFLIENEISKSNFKK